MGFFGTDGVRGKSSVNSTGDPIKLFEEEMMFTPALCAKLALSASNFVGHGSVIIGWDRRPNNEVYANLLIEKLSLGGRDVLVIGETSTPALQYTMIAKDAVLGFMITASHNPAEDTGLKVILQGGRKPSEFEELVIESGIKILKQDENSSVIGAIKQISPREYREYVKEKINQMKLSKNWLPESLLIDGSSGWISSWLSELLTEMGIDCIEVSNRELEINHECGAGNLFEGLTMTWLDCKESQHALLRKISPEPRGMIIGFSFDGDGDRCLMIVSNGDGIVVVGGDGFLRLYSASLNEDEDFSLAYTIQSSLDIPKSFQNLGGSLIIETGVGDRQLQHALLDATSDFRIGAEPSGHVILEHKYRNLVGLWGDGVITMFQFLSLGLDPEIINSTILTNGKGINLSKSVFPSDRSLWKSDNSLAEELTSNFSSMLDVEMGSINVKQVRDKSETLIIESSSREIWSLTVRNSGTEQKTRMTLRTTSNERKFARDLLNRLFAFLERNLKIRAP